MTSYWNPNGGLGGLGGFGGSRQNPTAGGSVAQPAPWQGANSPSGPLYGNGFDPARAGRPSVVSDDPQALFRAVSDPKFGVAGQGNSASGFNPTPGAFDRFLKPQNEVDFIRSLYNQFGGNTTGVSGADLAYWMGQLGAAGGDRARLTGQFQNELRNYAGTDPAGLQRQAYFRSR